MIVSDFWKSFEVSITSFDDLVRSINQIMERAVKRKIQFAWRGQVNAEWALHSSLYRRLSLSSSKVPRESNLSSAEDEILIDLHRWGLHSSSHAGRLSILNQLALLQHYGAPTRLIDVTFNAWVGAWFAVEEKWSNGTQTNEADDARLFAVDVTGRLINENEHRNWEDLLTRPWSSSGAGGISKKAWETSVFAWKPSNLDARIFAQNGAFLLGGVPSTSKPDGNRLQFPKSTRVSDGYWAIDEVRGACALALRPHAFDPKRGEVTSGALYTFRISAGAKKPIRDKLERMFGYKHSTIYPDYSGFASFGTPRLRSW